jgi:VanZ family protein
MIRLGHFRVGGRPNPERLLLLICLVGILGYSLARFDEPDTVPHVQDRVREALHVNLPVDWPGMLGHFGAFLALGILISAAHGSWVRRRPFIATAGLVAGACLAIEIVQLLQPARHARLTDFAVHVSGLSLGLWGTTRWPAGRRSSRVVQAWVWRHTRLLCASLLTVAAFWWWIGVLQPTWGALRMDWSPHFPLAIGNELDRLRPWRGEVQFVGLYGRALAEHDVRARYAAWRDYRGGARAGMRGLLAGWDFRDGPARQIAPQGEIQCANLVLDVPENVEWADGGVVLTTPTLLATRGPAAALTRAIAESGSFSVEAWVLPANATQRGPARIVTVSQDVGLRNFSLAQEGPDAVFRVRNRRSGGNGTRVQLVSAGLEGGDLQHLVAVYQGGSSTIYRNGRRLGATIDLSEPSRYLLLGSGEAGRAVSAIVFSAAAGAPALCLVYGYRRRRWTSAARALALTFALASAPYVMSRLWLGAPLHVSFFFWVAGALVVLSVGSARYLSGRAPRPREPRGPLARRTAGAHPDVEQPSRQRLPGTETVVDDAGVRG